MLREHGMEEHSMGRAFIAAVILFVAGSAAAQEPVGTIVAWHKYFPNTWTLCGVKWRSS